LRLPRSVFPIRIEAFASLRPTRARADPRCLTPQTRRNKGQTALERRFNPVVPRSANERRRMNGRLKRGPALVCDLIPLPTQKTRATAEGGSQKGHYRLLPKEFRRDGFTYRQIAREGNAAIYEHTWNGCPNPSIAYEVIRIRRRDGFQISDRFVEPAEVYPRSELWGVDGFTFTNRNKAFAKLSEILLEEPAKTGREVN